MITSNVTRFTKQKIYNSQPIYNVSSLAPEYNEETNCNTIELIQTPIHLPSTPSNYTNQGKRKACPTDPIRSQSDILKIEDYILSNGRTPQLRLRNHALFVLGISVGIRTCDLLRLQIKDILNSDGNIVDEIKVFESKTHKRNYPFLNDASKKAISSYLDSLGHFSYDDILFKKFGKSGKACTSHNIYELMISIGKALNLDYNMGAYTMRKTFAYWTIKLHPNNLDTMITLQEMLNHDSMNTTLHYSGIAKDNIKNMYDDISQIFSPEMKEPQYNQSTNNVIEQIYNLISQEINKEEILEN